MVDSNENVDNLPPPPAAAHVFKPSPETEASPTLPSITITTLFLLLHAIALASLPDPRTTLELDIDNDNCERRFRFLPLLLWPFHRLTEVVKGALSRRLIKQAADFEKHSIFCFLIFPCSCDSPIYHIFLWTTN
jgi:hypothetical protein